MTGHPTTCICAACERDAAEAKAWDSLSRYKFQMFGYWAAIWVHMNRMCSDRKPSPFRNLVLAAKTQRAASGLRRAMKKSEAA